MFPYYASYKLDGIRCLIQDGMPMSRTLTGIPNKYVQQVLGHHELNGLDGELIVGVPYADDVFNTTQSGVMSIGGIPQFTFYVFDYWNGPEGFVFKDRWQVLRDVFEKPPYQGWPHIKLWDQKLVNSMQELEAMHDDALELGYEGLIIRSMDSPYKFGRSTPKQGWMMKCKRFVHGEATIVGFEELMHNENDLEMSNTGAAKRSKKKANLVPAGCLGALRVKDVVSGVEFGVGSGFDQAQREKFWQVKDQMIGLMIRYKHFEVGAKDAPRFPIFDGFVHPDTIGEPK